MLYPVPRWKAGENFEKDPPMTAVLQAISTFTLHPSAEHEGVMEVHPSDAPPGASVGDLLDDWIVLWDDPLLKSDGTLYYEALSRAYVEGDGRDYILP